MLGTLFVGKRTTKNYTEALDKDQGRVFLVLRLQYYKKYALSERSI